MTEKSKNYLENKHKKWNATPYLTEFFRKNFGLAQTSLQKIVLGNDNEIYFVKTEGKLDMVVRIHRAGKVSLHDEMWTLQKVKSLGIPVPEVLYLGYLSEEKENLKIMVQKKCLGQSLSELESTLSKKEMAKMAGQMGEVLAKIHSISVEGFGQRLLGKWEFANWEEIFNQRAYFPTKNKQIFAKAGFELSEIEAAINFLLKNKHKFAAQAKLCHGDFMLEHIFVDSEGKISGVIDWGMFEGNDPNYELGFLSEQEPEFWQTYGKDFLSGYGFAYLDEEIQFLHSLQTALGWLCYFLLEGEDQQEIALHATQLKKYLAKI